VTETERAEAQATAVLDEAEAILARQQAIAARTQANDAVLRQLATQGVGITEASIIGVRLTVLIEHLLGDESAGPRLDYEEKVSERIGQLLGELGAQVARQKLTQGIVLPGPNGAGPKR